MIFQGVKGLLTACVRAEFQTKERAAAGPSGMQFFLESLPGNPSSAAPGRLRCEQGFD
jgi:hypothetical protein